MSIHILTQVSFYTTWKDCGGISLQMIFSIVLIKIGKSYMHRIKMF